MATIAKNTPTQKMRRARLPYTQLITRTVPILEEEQIVRFVPEYHLFGYTCEDTWVASEDGEDGEWKYVWESHDLGVVATPQDAYPVAAEWRATVADGR